MANNFTGTLPSEWSNLTSLTKLYLFSNQLSGTLPKEWSTLVFLASCDLASTNLSGTLPAEWAGLTSLSLLHLYENSLVGSLPKEWAALTKLTDLELSVNNLSGTLPPEWMTLSKLTTLYLKLNQLSGTLPKEWATFVQLKELYLYSNNFTGSLPPEWSALASLTRLYMWNNHLSGTLPKEWSNLAMLSSCEISTNNLTGTLPPEWSAMASLSTIIFKENQLTGSLPPEWASLGQLSYFDFSGNKLTGTLPPEWSSLGVLTRIALDQNSLTGSLPPDWSALTQLRGLKLSQNHLSGTLPPEWTSLVQLTLLEAFSNNLTGTLPPEWSTFTSVSYLSLYSNQLSGTLPPEWSALTSLSTLYLYSNALTGTLPPDWALLPQVTEIAASGNMLTGTLPPEWSILTTLTTVTLYNNRLSGTLPKGWSSLSQLYDFEISENNFSGALPSEWSALTGVTYCVLSRNSLSGTLPPEWSLLASAVQLDLSSNNLTGTLPPEWSALTALQTLSLEQNHITGTLPREWAGLNQVTVIFLPKNRLTGTLPREWSSLGQLSSLALYDNQLTGTLPKEWSVLDSKLTMLGLHQNRLSGTIPREWGGLKALTKLYLLGNQLSGTIPQELALLGNLTSVNFSSNLLSGPVPNQWLRCLSPSTPAAGAAINLHDNKLRNTPIDLVTAVDLLSCNHTALSSAINLCGNVEVVNRTTIRMLQGKGFWPAIRPLLFPLNCSVDFSNTVSDSVTESFSRSLSVGVSPWTASQTRLATLTLLENSASPSISTSASRRTGTSGRSETASRSLSVEATPSATCQAVPLIYSNVTMLVPGDPVNGLFSFPLSLTVGLVPIAIFGSSGSRQPLVLVEPHSGILFKKIGNASCSFGYVSSAALVTQGVTAGGGAAAVELTISDAAIGSISLASLTVLEVSFEMEATGSCLEPGHRERLSFQWTLAPLPPSSALAVATMAMFRSSTLLSTMSGRPLTTMTATGLVSIVALDECMFSDVDPLDSSVSPITSAALGPPLGQYYRGAVVVALSTYGIVCLAALSIAVFLRWRAGNDDAGFLHSLTPHLATLHIPSVGMIVVGLFGQGMATCGVSLIRLAVSPSDVVLGSVSLLVSAMVVLCALYATTSGLQVRAVVQKQPVRRGLIGRFLALSTWRMHWKDTSGPAQFKRRHMMLIDDLHRPWWSAVEMCSGFVQGGILGVRVSSLAVCRAQLWALACHCLGVFIAAVYFRPCGADLSNIFLIVLKFGSLATAVLVLMHALTLNSSFVMAAEGVTSVMTGLSTLQTILQVLSAALVLLPNLSIRSMMHAWRNIRRRNTRRRRSGAERAAPDGQDEEYQRHGALVVPLTPALEFTEVDERCPWRIGGGALAQREVMEQLIAAMDPISTHEERLRCLIFAAAASRR